MHNGSIAQILRYALPYITRSSEPRSIASTRVRAASIHENILMGRAEPLIVIGRNALRCSFACRRMSAPIAHLELSKPSLSAAASSAFQGRSNPVFVSNLSNIIVRISCAKDRMIATCYECHFRAVDRPSFGAACNDRPLGINA